MKSALFFVEAVLGVSTCAIPILGGLPIILFGGISMLSYNPKEGLQGIAIALLILLAIQQYVVLASHTINGTLSRFGPLFWLGMIGALLGVILSFGGHITTEGFITSAPIVLVTAHFIGIQLLRRNPRCRRMMQ